MSLPSSLVHLRDHVGLCLVALLFVVPPSGFAQQQSFSWQDTYGKSPTQFTPDEWRAIIDAQWGADVPAFRQRLVFDRWWNDVNRNFGLFHKLDFDIDDFRARYRPEVEAGVSRGRFAAIMNHFGYRLDDLHTYVWDNVVRSTPMNKGVPLHVIGQWGTNQRFGALLTPLADSTVVVYRVAPNHPLGLELGDLVLGYDGMAWKDIYPKLMEAELPLFLNSVNGSSPSSHLHYHLQAAGLNWHLFDTIDILKYSTGDTLHFDTNLLAGQSVTLWGRETMDIPGVVWPDRSAGDRVSWGIVEGTRVGYVYVTSWSFTPQFRIREQFEEAIDSLMHHVPTDGLIIDLRFNTGGGALAREGLQLLFNEVTPTVGFDKRNDPTDRLSMQPDPSRLEANLIIQADPTTYYDKPIAVLMGPGSISAGELESMRLSFHPRARIFGKPAAGGNSGSDFISLGDNDWFASRASGPLYLVPGRVYMAHTSFQPDEYVWFDRDDVANGIDTVVEAALDWISNDTQVSIEEETIRPTTSILHVDAYPNPFAKSITLSVELDRPTALRIEVYNMLGQHMTTLTDAFVSSGTHQFVWSPQHLAISKLPAGHYIYRVETDTQTRTGTVIHLP